MHGLGNQTLACAFENAVTDENNNAVVVRKVKTRQRTAQKIAKIISHGEGSCFEH